MTSRKTNNHAEKWKYIVVAQLLFSYVTAMIMVLKNTSFQKEDRCEEHK